MKTLWRRLAWTLLALVLLVLAAWALVPMLVKSQIEKRGSEALGRAVSVGDVSFAPWALRLTLQGLTVAGSSGDADASPQLSIDRLFIDASARSLIDRAPVLEALEIDRPRLRLARLGPGRYDIDDVVQRLQAARSPPPEPGADAPARFAIYNVQLTGGELRFDDQPVKRQHEVLELTLGLPFVSNLPADIEVRVEPQLSAAVNGSSLALTGHTLPFSQDRASELQLKLTAMDLADWWAYLPASLPLRPSGGLLDSELALRFAQPAGASPRIGLSGRVVVGDLSVATPAGASLLGWRRLALALDDVRPLEKKVGLSSLELEGLVADLRRDAAGRLEWQTLFASPSPTPTSAVVAASAASAPSAQAAAGPTAQPAPWQFKLTRLALSDARLRWRDAGTSPVAAINLSPVSLESGPLAWPDAAAAPLKLAFQILGGPEANQPAGQVDLQGTLSAQSGKVGVDLTLALTDGDLAAAAPYLRSSLAARLGGRLSGTSRIEWAGGEAARQVLSLSNLQLRDLNLIEGAPAKAPALRVASIAVDDAKVDLLTKRFDLGALNIKDPQVRVARNAEGRWNAVDWLQPQAAKAGPAEPEAASAPWRTQVKAFRLTGGRLQFDDAATSTRPVSVNLNAVQLGLRDFAWPARGVPSAFDVAAVWPNAREPGEPPARLSARGQLAMAPLAVRGTVAAERLPVHAFEPYFASRVPVLLRRAELGIQGSVDFQGGADGPTLALKGDVLLADVRVQTRGEGAPALGVAAEEGGDDLLTWQSLTLRPLAVRLKPQTRPAVEIGEAVLTDFFSRLIITEQGRFNLRDVQGGAETAAAAAAPAEAASAPPAARTGGGVDLVVGGTKLAGGRIDFTDRFIRPSYSAQLTELNGSIGRFASGSREMATLDLRGRAAGTALLEIRGALNPTADPLALDISARATDLELAPLSPYASKYAGYAIERGKLSLDIAYRIDPDGKLLARNQLVLNQLTFGERVEGPDVTKLPVRLAVALLTDRNGVIDINLPISGSVNDPQFSVFGLVLRVLGNLIVKAVTAPFALLAGGGGEDISHIDFVPGTQAISPASKPVLERVGKALADRPALRMTVTGTADPESEGASIQSAALEARLQTEQRRELARAGTAAAADAVLPPLSEAERLRLVQQIYGETRLPNKPRNLIGMAKSLPLAEMEALLKEATPVNADVARELALQRGLAVRDALIATGLPAERLFLGAPKLRSAADDEKTPWTPRAQLSLAAP